MEDPFLLFPEEVWEAILDRLEDSRDVWNLLKSYPGLDATFQKRKHFWFFDQIIPFITTWSKMISQRDLLNCRPVCKRWSKAVNNFLENQPQLRPYRSGSSDHLQFHGQFYWDPKAYLEKYKDQESSDFVADYYGSTELSFPNLQPTSSVLRFLAQTESYATWRNPFLSRSLSLVIWETNERNNEDVASFLKSSLDLLDKFGRHVWSFKINFRIFSLKSVEIWKWLVQSLSLVPNLRSLNITVSFISNVCRRQDLFEKVGQISFPNLPHLESVHVGSIGFPSKLSQRLISRFSTQIRKTSLEFGFWEHESYCHCHLLNNLTELELRDMHPGQMLTVKDLLLSLQAPHLARLQLKFYMPSEQNCSSSLEDDIYKWLGRFPNLKYFQFGGYLKESGSLCPEANLLPSLEFLSIRDSSTVNYNFLRCLPSLKHLQLYVDFKPMVVDLSNEPVVRIREQIQSGTMYDSSIWELLPKLRSVTLLMEHIGVFNSRGELKSHISFDRAQYEYFKERGISVDDESINRRDIVRFFDKLSLQQQEVLSRDISSDDDEDELDIWNSDSYDSE